MHGFTTRKRPKALINSVAARACRESQDSTVRASSLGQKRFRRSSFSGSCLCDCSHSCTSAYCYYYLLLLVCYYQLLLPRLLVLPRLLLPRRRRRRPPLSTACRLLQLLPLMLVLLHLVGDFQRRHTGHMVITAITMFGRRRQPVPTISRSISFHKLSSPHSDTAQPTQTLLAPSVSKSPTPATLSTVPGCTDSLMYCICVFTWISCSVFGHCFLKKVETQLVYLQSKPRYPSEHVFRKAANEGERETSGKARCQFRKGCVQESSQVACSKCVFAVCIAAQQSRAAHNLSGWT